MIVAHGGGQQLRKSNDAYEVIRDWIAGGAKLDRLRHRALLGSRFIRRLAGSYPRRIIDNSWRWWLTIPMARSAT